MERVCWLFTNARIFDGSGRAPFAGEVLVENNRIEAVTDGLSRINRPEAQVIDCGGRTLMPGLVEAHAHLSWPSSVGRIFDTMTLPREEHLLVTAHNAKVTLDAGFTSAYSAGSLGPRFEIALRDEIDGGWLPGPRVRASSLERLPDGALGLKAGEGTQHRRGPEAMRAYVREMAKAGVDSIKFLLSSDDAFEANGSQTLTYTEEEVAAIGDEARNCGVWLACHAQAAGAVKLAVKHGFRIVYHCSYADSEALDMLEAKKDQIFVAPAIGLMYTRTYEAGPFGIARSGPANLGAAVHLERMQELYPKMRARGIRVLPGGDYGFPYNQIGTNARDLEWFVKLLGYTPAETLVAATRLGGELMGREPLGQLKPGYLADLLLVDGDPTADIRLLQDREKLLIVMKDGKLHKRKPPIH
ncbi:MAG TPA: amidohydrolase family protein [Burkholderiales bacterium]|nr:amidohydrolase family protein [Burkholderiales bacterium]